MMVTPGQLATTAAVCLTAIGFTLWQKHLHAPANLAHLQVTSLSVPEDYATGWYEVALNGLAFVQKITDVIVFGVGQNILLRINILVVAFLLSRWQLVFVRCMFRVGFWSALRGLPRWQAVCHIAICSFFGVWLVLVWRTCFIGQAFHTLTGFRPEAALQAEAERRAAAEKGGRLLTLSSLPRIEQWLQQTSANVNFPLFNFVEGFRKPGLLNFICWAFKKLIGLSRKWEEPVLGETVGITSFQDFAKEQFGKAFPYSFFDKYYTSKRVPSWEDNANHHLGISMLDYGMKTARTSGLEPILTIRQMEPRFAFDNEALSKVVWDGFRYVEPLNIKYASNGVYGIAVVEELIARYNTSGEVLGLLMTDSVFSAHLKRSSWSGRFHLDLTSLQKYTPIPGYARLGGKASFVIDGDRLRTVRMTYMGKTYTRFDDPKVNEDYQLRSTRSGWRFAEGAIIASLLSMTNLVMHVKDLHLELAASFQAVTIDAFAGEPKHPVRRLLDPFITRSGQATNDNFKLLFEYHAAEFSLAPLPYDEQLRLIDDAIRENPLNLAEMDMEYFSKSRRIDKSFSTSTAVNNASRWGWRWHYRALTVQQLYDKLIWCWLEASYGSTEKASKAIAADRILQAWWRSMVDHLPSLRLATVVNPEWASSRSLTMTTLSHVLRTLMVWLSWIHEDVGHSAASFVYNPVYTPMCIPEDGVGVPLQSWAFNALAYRGFVFLDRAKLLEEAPPFWFNDNKACAACFKDFQRKLRHLGVHDVAFSECGKNGFYSCVDRVETAVSS